MKSWTKLEITLLLCKLHTTSTELVLHSAMIYLLCIEFNALRTRVVMSTLKVSSELLRKYILDFVGFYCFLF